MAGIDNNTLLYLKGDSLTDLSLNNNSITNNSVTVLEDASIGKYLDFNGSNSYLILNNINLFNFGSGDFTIEFYTKFPYSYMENHHILGKRASASSDHSYTVNFGPSSMNFETTGIKLECTMSKFNINSWQHIAFVRNNNTMYMYLDGKVVDSKSINGSIHNSSQPLKIGAVNSSPGGFFKGCIYNLRISNVSRYTKDFTPPTQPFNTIDIDVTNQTKDKIDFNISKLGQEVVNKVELLVNNQASKTYTSIGDLTYNIPNNTLAYGEKVIIRVTFDNDYTEEKEFNYEYKIDNLTTSSSLKELIDRQELLTNSIEVQKNTLKSILESKNVEVSEEEDKLSILIQKVDELSESPIKWIYKDGVEKVEITSFTSGHSDYTYLPITKKEGYIDLSITNRANTFVHLSTKDKIDLTNYSKLKFEIDTNEVYSLGYVGNTLSIDSVFNGTSQPAVLLINKVGRNVFELDIKNISGEHYVCHSIQRVSVGSISSKVYKIWLEK